MKISYACCMRHHRILPAFLLAAPTFFATLSAHAERPRGTYVWSPQPLESYDGDLPRILYLNRCADGCTIEPGAESAIDNTSTIVNQTSYIGPFPHGDASWDLVVDCVKEQFSRFDIAITDEDPGEVPHFEAIVAGDAADIGAFGAGGIAPFSCGVMGNSINFTFAETLGGNAQVLCEVVAQESGHVMGLEHAMLCEDPMTYLEGCGTKSFQDIDAECGEFSTRTCECTGGMQNSVQHLLDIFGPGNRPATATISIDRVSEDPDGSNGDGVLEPGEEVIVDLSLTNDGNFPTGELAIKFKTGGDLRLKDKDRATVGNVEPRRTTQVQLVATVQDSACGNEVEIDVTTELEGESWSASSKIPVGIGSSEWSEDFVGGASWSVEASEEEAVGWEYGVPEETFFAGRVIQSEGGSGGPGSSAWMTGLSGRWDEAAASGTSSLVSTPIDVSDWHRVTGISYRVWYLAYDRSGGGLDPSSETHLVVELSSDGGKTWSEIDSLSGQEYRWEMRTAAVESVRASAEVLLRFTVQNPEGVGSHLVEVGIDEVKLTGGELLCSPQGGCGCRQADSSGMAWLLWLIPAWLWTRRTRVGAPLP